MNVYLNRDKGCNESNRPLHTHTMPFCSSSSLEELHSFLLKGSGDAASSGFGLGGLKGVEFIEGKIFLFDALEEVDFNGVVVVNEQPAAGVDEETRVILGEVSITYKKD